MDGRSLSSARLLLVDDEPSLAAALHDGLAPKVRELRVESSVAGARLALREFPADLLLLDFSLPDGNGLDVVAAARALCPVPAIVAISGSAGPLEAFRFAELGVRGYVEKPLDWVTVESALILAVSQAPDLTPHLKSSVGLRGLTSIEEEVRRTVVGEALGRARGSRRGAAGLLSISRQFLQHVLRKNA